jgi:hypothetical protein
MRGGPSKTALIVAPCALLLLAACKKDPEPAPSPLLLPQGGSLAGPKALDSATPPAALPLGVTWEDPTAWQRVPLNNPMRKATYRIPKASGDPEDGELAVFYFGPGQGGSVEANVQRWIAQFQGVGPDDVKRANRTAHGLRQHTVEIEKGSFSSGMPGGPTKMKEDFGLLGGIVESPSGPYFFKLTGPSATVKSAREAFLKLLDSVKAT